MVRTGNEQFARDMCDALGLPKHTRSLQLSVEPDCVVTVKCEYYPELPDGNLGDLLTIFRRLEARSVTSIGDTANRYERNDG